MKKLRNKGIPDLDMTPLLDVIFIILMVVICHQMLNTDNAKQDIEQLNEQLDVATAENEVHKAQLEAYDSEEALVAFVTLYADYKTNNPKIRYIKLAYNNSYAISDIEITPDNESEAFASFKDALTSFISDKQDMPVMLVLDESHILYRDQVRLTETLKELETEYDNLYLTGKQEAK